MTRLITHKVIEVVYPLGDITDPLTGKKVVSGKYRSAIKHIYQENIISFIYITILSLIFIEIKFKKK